MENLLDPAADSAQEIWKNKASTAFLFVELMVPMRFF